MAEKIKEFIAAGREIYLGNLLNGGKNLLNAKRFEGELIFQIMENYEQIFYLDCPHFTVGRVDQWGEQGYLLFEGKVYAYEEDRKDQCGRTHSPMTIEKFLAFAKEHQITIPADFLRKLTEDESGTAFNLG